jgi:hypothetical protein
VSGSGKIRARIDYAVRHKLSAVMEVLIDRGRIKRHQLYIAPGDFTDGPLPEIQPKAEYREEWGGELVRLPSHWKCEHCHVGYELYMVEDDVWQAAGLGYSNNVCLLCLTRRLGRELTLDDFTDAGCNGLLRYLKNQRKVLRRAARRRHLWRVFGVAQAQTKPREVKS